MVKQRLELEVGLVRPAQLAQGERPVQPQHAERLDVGVGGQARVEQPQPLLLVAREVREPQDGRRVVRDSLSTSFFAIFAALFGDDSHSIARYSRYVPRGKRPLASCCSAHTAVFDVKNPRGASRSTSSYAASAAAWSSISRYVNAAVVRRIRPVGRELGRARELGERLLVPALRAEAASSLVRLDRFGRHVVVARHASLATRKPMCAWRRSGRLRLRIAQRAHARPGLANEPPRSTGSPPPWSLAVHSQTLPAMSCRP